MKSRVIPEITDAKHYQPGNSHTRLVLDCHISAVRIALACFCFNFNLLVLIPSLPAARNHAHAFPVVGKLFSAIQTDDVSAGLLRGIRPALRLPAGKRETYALMPATEQSVEKLHISSKNLRNPSVSGSPLLT